MEGVGQREVALQVPCILRSRGTYSARNLFGWGNTEEIPSNVQGWRIEGSLNARVTSVDGIVQCLLCQGLAEVSNAVGRITGSSAGRIADLLDTDSFEVIVR